MLRNGPHVRMTSLTAGDVETIANVLDTGDQDTTDQEDDAGDAVVKLGDDALGLRVDNLYSFQT